MEPGAMTEAGGKTPGMETRKLITATDNQYSGMLLKALDEQRGLGLFCDVTVIVEDRKFRAHRNILSASSTYFHQLFAVAGQVVELNFIRGEVFAEILNYIYSSKIVRVRADLLDELIKSGELLGVKFLADLGVPLQQVKNMSSDASTSELPILEANGSKVQKPPAPLETQHIKLGKPIITESFSLYREPCDSTKITISDSDDDDDDDVIFCSELAPAKDRSVEAKVITQIPPCPNPTASSEMASSTNSNSAPQPVATAAPRLDSSTLLPSPAENQKPVDPLPPPAPQSTTPKVLVLNSSQVGVGSSHEIEVLPIPEENQQPSIHDSLTDMETNIIDEEEEEDVEDVEDDDDILGLSSPGSASSSSLVQQPTTPKPAAVADSPAAQKKQVVNFPPEPISQPNEFKIQISDILSGGLKDTPPNLGPKHVMEGQKTITLDKATGIESLSTGCKVYANIGEDTYDIVIPVKNEADGEVRLDDVPRTSGHESTNRKRLKVKHDDHYELIMDGKVYYICIVCRRSYVCLTSLRRHFNVHSWEKKYPCRYCEKVFPLAEYRTKHEIHHTGERRYQCLACGQCFINYQVMATHLRSVHSQDPSGESKLYRLHPCRSLQIRNYAYISGNSNNLPVTSDNALVYSGNPSKETTQEPVPNQPVKPMTWDDIFVPQANESLFKQNPSDGTSEFEFVIPESY
ncbi:transcriptional regulator Kaiso isoform X2 [Crotalus tigris]|uniref:transcriptional regulator Kaiso isoform X2 n=1 Tax=Crotalus tigris TaxID=88082 RepID=UPI00192F5057|nr:transcriptional regulator Kaiso isoform X2 [Crotalus tigris]